MVRIGRGSQPYSTNVTYTPSGSDYYVKFMDKAGNESNPFTMTVPWPSSVSNFDVFTNVDFDTANRPIGMSFTFNTNRDLAAGDTISIALPSELMVTGTSDSNSVSLSYGKGTLVSADVSYSDHVLTLTTQGSIKAGVSVEVDVPSMDSSYPFVLPSKPGQYTFHISTSTESVPASYSLAVSAEHIGDFAVTPGSYTTMASSVPYRFTFTAGTTLDWNNPVTITFPEDFTLPSEINADSVTVNGVNVESVYVYSESHSIDLYVDQPIDINTPVTILFDADAHMGNPGSGAKNFTLSLSGMSSPASSVNVAFGSGTADIVSFAVPGQKGSAVFDVVHHTVNAQVYAGIDLSALVPVIEISPGATISPLSGVSTNFNSTVSYMVTAEDGQTKQNWDVTVTNISGNNSLSGLNVITDAAHVQQIAVSANISDYITTVAGSVYSVYVQPSLQDTNATFQLFYNSYPFSVSDAVYLSIGNNTITVEVTAPTGGLRKYTIVIFREVNNTGIASVQFGGRTFRQNDLDYFLDVGPRIINMTVAVQLADPNAQLSTVTGSTYSTGSMYITNLSFDTAQNVYDMKVTAQDGTYRNYKLHIIRHNYPDKTQLGVSPEAAIGVNDINNYVKKYYDDYGLDASDIEYLLKQIDSRFVH